MESEEIIIGLYHNATQSIAFHTYLFSEIDAFKLDASSKTCAMITEDLKNDVYHVIIKGIEIRVSRRDYGVIVKSKDSMK